MSKERLEFRYGVEPKNHYVWVGVNSLDHYTRTLSFLQSLSKKLKRAIPFKYRVVSEPKVEIMGGRHLSGKASVEMQIRFDITDAEALSRLKSKGFSKGFEEKL